MKHIFFSLLFIFATTTLLAQPKHEVRAVWLTTIGGIDWPHSYAYNNRTIEKQKNELRCILDRLQKANINTVLLQTRVRATTIYPSYKEPWDGCLSGNPGKSPGYDALSFAIEECHKRGMEIHAWIVTIPVGKWNSYGCARLRKRHPGLIQKIGPDGYMDPEKPQTATYLADMCGEIVSNYDVDGIHLDYIRYPETWPMKVSGQQGRRHITNIVKSIHRRVKTLKPWVKMSCSPIGKRDDLSRYNSRGWNAYTRVCQDAEGWMKEGLMDMIFPMMYFRDNNFYPFALDWAENAHGRIVVPGLGIYFMSPKEKDWALSDITREMEVLRNLDMGCAFFRSKFFTDNVKGIYDYTSDVFNNYPALVPPMSWEKTSAPVAPSVLQRDKTASGASILLWNAVDDDTTRMAYNIYSSRQYPVDINDARNLIVIHKRSNRICIPADSTRFYAVTSTDRYGNESDARQEAQPELVGTCSERHLNNGLLTCDGHHLILPPLCAMTDADYLIIETLQGTMVASHTYSQTRIDVNRLDDGIYVLRAIGRKGLNHRLGYFAIRRRF